MAILKDIMRIDRTIAVRVVSVSGSIHKGNEWYMYS